jgi:hypothetical protein
LDEHSLQLVGNFRAFMLRSKGQAVQARGQQQEEGGLGWAPGKVDAALEKWVATRGFLGRLMTQGGFLSIQGALLYQLHNPNLFPSTTTPTGKIVLALARDKQRRSDT